jgi:DNA-directed RNA polymerase specialized sigma24 family protein
LDGTEHRWLPAGEGSDSAAPEAQQVEEPNLSLAAKVLELLTALDPGNRLRKAPPIKVFLLRYRQNLSRAEIARICSCNKSLVGIRLKTIQEKLPWRPQQLRKLSAHVEAMQDAVSDSRAKRIYRKGAAYGDEDDGRE